MSSPEVSDNRTNQTNTNTNSNTSKGKKPVPRFMSLTWLRLHMKVFIYALVAAFVVSLFFITYGTKLSYEQREKDQQAHDSRVSEELDKLYGLPEALKSKEKEAIVTGYLSDNSSFTIDVKSAYREFINQKQNIANNRNIREAEKKFYLTYGVSLIRDEAISNLIKGNLAAAYASSKNLVTPESLNSVADKKISEEYNKSPKQFNAALLQAGYSNMKEYKESFKRNYAMGEAFKYFLNKDKVNAASSSEEIFKAYYDANKIMFKKDDEISFEHLLVSPSDLADSITIDDNQVINYYNDHKANFSSSKQAEVYHIFIKTDEKYLANVACSEEEIQKLYNDEKEARFKQEEEVKARHILIKAQGEGDENQKLENAKKTIDELYERVKNGEDFAKLASENSDDPGSAAEGGDLGFFGRGQMVEEFEKAAFAAEVGSVTEPVKTKFGYHIIKVEEKKAAGFKPYEEVKDLLAEEVKTKLANEKAYSVLKEVRNNYLKDQKEDSFIASVKQYSNGESAKNNGKLPVFFKGEIIKGEYSDADSAILKDELCDGEDHIDSQIEHSIFEADASKLPLITEVIKTTKGYHLFLIKNFLAPKELSLTDNLKEKVKTIVARERAENEEAEKLAKKLVAENSSVGIDVMLTAYGHGKSQDNCVHTAVPYSTNQSKEIQGLGGFGAYSDDGRTYLPEFHKALQTAIKDNKMNTYLEPFKTKYGWNILKVTEYKGNLYEPFEKCRDVIRRIVTQEPSDAEINQFFENNRSSFDMPARRTFRQIVCAKEELANSLHSELKAGAAFSMLAKKFSNDYSASSGGLMPSTVKGTYANYAKELEDAIWSLKVGEYSAPIKTDRGYYIIMIESETPEIKATVEKVSSNIRRELGQRYQNEAISYFLTGLENQATIVRNQELIDLIQ